MQPPRIREGDAARVNGRGQYVADFFAGVGHVSRAVRRAGFSSREWEVLKGPDHDLTCPAVLKKIEQDISSSKIIAAMIATPCTSFSRARDRTRVIRSQTSPWGCNLDGASENDLRSLKMGNDEHQDRQST